MNSYELQSSRSGHRKVQYSSEQMWYSFLPPTPKKETNSKQKGNDFRTLTPEVKLIKQGNKLIGKPKAGNYKLSKLGFTYISMNGYLRTPQYLLPLSWIDMAMPSKWTETTREQSNNHAIELANKNPRKHRAKRIYVNLTGWKSSIGLQLLANEECLQPIKKGGKQQKHQVFSLESWFYHSPQGIRTHCTR